MLSVIVPTTTKTTTPFIIGFGSRARVGKDFATDVALTVCKKLGVRARRKAFADPLKEEIADAIQEKFGIDVFDATGEQKELIRPTIVAHGMDMRAVRADYWIERLQADYEQEEIDLQSFGTPATEVIVISDVRFENEVEFVKRHGLYIDIVPGDKRQTSMFVNIEEQKNAPKCGDLADYVFENSFNNDFAQRIAGMVARHVYRHDINLGQKEPGLTTADALHKLVASNAVAG